MDKSFMISFSKKYNFAFKIRITKFSKLVPQVAKKENTKIFCIGFGKTGTTSLASALKEFGFKLGIQSVGEMLVEDWFNKRYDRIINYCYSADAFQDLPFWLPGLYKTLDVAFPGSKFILTVRKNPDEWYNSLINFHTKLYAFNKNNLPTENDLREATGRYKGWALDMQKFIYNYPSTPLYDEFFYKKMYADHIDDIQNYFTDRKDDLLILNVAEPDSYKKLADYLGIKVSKHKIFPWENKT